jgi:RNA-dependent RNA polymerase
VTQISLGGFESNVTAKRLSEFLEFESGLIWRCRLKSSWTPPESYPLYGPVPSSANISDDYEKVVPHAFVQFAEPDGANRALDLAGRSELVFDRHVLRASCGAENSSYRVGRRRTIDPFRFVILRTSVEMGCLTLSSFCIRGIISLVVCFSEHATYILCSVTHKSQKFECTKF